MSVLALIDLNTAIIVGVALIVGGYTLVRGRADVWKSNFDAERERADRLTKELADARTKVATLESLPTVERLEQMLDTHHQRETAAWERIMLLLEQMTAQLTVLSNGVRK